MSGAPARPARGAPAAALRAERPARARGRAAAVALAGAAAGAAGEAIVARAGRPAGEAIVAGAGRPAGAPAAAPRFAERFDAAAFARGNLHAHSSLSDGDAPPEAVFAWYREHGYQFAALTDHNLLADEGAARAASRPGFVALRGEEISLWGGGRPVHLNAFCARAGVGGGEFAAAAEAIAYAAGRVGASGGVALLNHPNFDWALAPADVRGARGARLLEIASGHPHVNAGGDASRPSHERLWDEALSAGLDAAGAAVDDAHHFLSDAPEPAARPGRAWVGAFVDELSEGALCRALAAGRLYASTGVGLRRLAAGERSYAVWPEDEGDEVTFVGAGGRELARCRAPAGGACRYELRGGEGYVRARVGRVDGAAAWAPAVRVVEGPGRGDGPP